MTREEAIAIQKAMRDNLHETGKDYPYRDYMIPLMKESCDIAIQALEQEPCEDCISREKAKQFLYERLDRLNDDELYDIFSRIIDDMYNELPSVTPQQNTEWIPISEGLPKEYADVICCTNKEEVFIATYLGLMNDGVPCFDDNNGMMCEGDVIAWMPLPQPYKAESEDKE